MKNQIEIVVFLGPSLSLSEAKKACPTAKFLPPVKCGDIINIIRLKPKIIAIIDGYFEHHAAIWHKEILFAIQSGVKVYGASSIGALRAAELDSHGMVGVGKTFKAYRDGLINDDDEVALLHTTILGCNPVSIPMVNIRATLDLALSYAIIDDRTSLLICDSAKKLFYQKRTFERSCELAILKGANRNTVRNFIQWLNEGNYVDQKKDDAIELLLLLSREYRKDKITANNRQAHSTVSIHLLSKNIMCRPGLYYFEWLPLPEKVALFSRFLGTTYYLLRRLAYALSACYAISMSNGFQFKCEMLKSMNDDILRIDDILSQKEWHIENDCSHEDKTAFVKRLLSIQRLADQKTCNKVDCYILILMKLTNHYIVYRNNITEKEENCSGILLHDFKFNEPLKFSVMYYIAILWGIIDAQVSCNNLLVNDVQVQKYSNRFRQKNNLYTQNCLQQWLLSNDLNLPEYHKMMTILAQFNYIVLQNNIDIFDVSYFDDGIWWYGDALRLTNVYSYAKELVNGPLSYHELESKYKRSPDSRQKQDIMSQSFPV